MKKKVLAGLAVATALCIFYLRISFDSATEANHPTSASQQASVSAAQSSLKRTLNEPRLRSGEQIQISENQSPACLAFWSEILKLNLDELSYPPKLLRLPEAGGCTTVPESLSRVQALYQKKCAPLFLDDVRAPESEAKWQEEIGSCVVSLYFLRAGISSQQVRGIKLSDINDLKLLTDLLASAFGKAMDQNSQPSEMIAVAKRILEIDPKIYGAHKALLIGEFLDGVGDVGPKKDDAYWNAMEDSIRRAAELNPNDPELAQLDQIAKTHAYDPSWTKTEAQRLLAENPNSSSAYDLLGFAEWRQGHRDAAFDALQKAIALDPKNESFRHTWNAIHAPDAKDKSYSVSVTVGLQFNDILK